MVGRCCSTSRARSLKIVLQRQPFLPVPARGLRSLPVRGHHDLDEAVLQCLAVRRCGRAGSESAEVSRLGKGKHRVILARRMAAGVAAGVARR